MSPAIRDDPRVLERFRCYLYLVARQRLQGEQQKRIDAGAMVEQTLREAIQQRSRFHGGSQADLAAWLRRILAHHLGAAFRTLHRDEEETPASPARLPERVVPNEEDPCSRIAEALLQLPEAQREALVLQYWHGLTLAEISSRFETTPVMVAGLLRSALSRLRELLPSAD